MTFEEICIYLRNLEHCDLHIFTSSSYGEALCFTCPSCGKLFKRWVVWMPDYVICPRCFMKCNPEETLVPKREEDESL
jgi:hypothetical protein